MLVKQEVNGKDSNIRARVNSRLKVDAEKVLKKRGLNLSEGIRIFLEQVITKQDIPFEVEKKPSANMLARIRRVNAKEKAMDKKYEGALW